MSKYGITSEEYKMINDFFEKLNYLGWGYLYTEAAKKIILKGIVSKAQCTKCGDEIRADEDSLCGNCAGEAIDKNDEGMPELILAG